MLLRARCIHLANTTIIWAVRTHTPYALLSSSLFKLLNKIHMEARLLSLTQACLTVRLLACLLAFASDTKINIEIYIQTYFLNGATLYGVDDSTAHTTYTHISYPISNLTIPSKVKWSELHERIVFRCNVANTRTHMHYDILTVLPHEFGLIWYGDDALLIAFARNIGFSAYVISFFFAILNASW